MNKKDKKEKNKELEKEMNLYQNGNFRSKIPFCIKAVFIKYWFFGAVCFFVFMGLGLNVGSNFNLVLIAGLVGGAVADLVCYNILKLIDHDNDEYKKFVIFKSSKFYSIFINVAYQILLFFLFSYSINWFKVITHSEESWFLREPLSQALLLTIFDGILISIKDLLVILFRKMKEKKNEL